MAQSWGWLGERLSGNAELARRNADILDLLPDYRPGPGEAAAAAAKPATPAALWAPRRPTSVADLLARRRVRLRDLGPEDAVQAETVLALDDLYLAGRDVLAVMFANEVRLPIPPEEAARKSAVLRERRDWLLRVAQTLGTRLLGMGLLPGAPDVLVVWRPTDHRPPLCFLEFKRPGGDSYLGTAKGKVVRRKRAPGQLSDEQELVRDLLQGWALPWAMPTGREQAMDALRGYGAPV